MQNFLTTLRREFRSPVPLVGWVFLSGITGLSGPFGTYGPVEFWARLIFWCAALGVAVGLLVTLRAWVLSRDWDLGPRGGSLVSAAAATVLVAPPLYLMHEALLSGASHPVIEALQFGLFLLFCLMTVGTVQYAEAPVLPPEPEPVVQPDPPMPTPADETALPRVVQRLDPDQQGRLVSMTVRNHHVDVVTCHGQGSLLLRFSDAIGETDPEEGTQVHRSHWVAWWAIEGTERAEGKLWLRLAGGGRVPVSKTHRAKLDLRGLI